MLSLQTVKLVKILKERPLPEKIAKELESLKLNPNNYVFVDYDITCPIGHRRYMDRICLKDEWEALKSTGCELEYIDHDKIIPND